MISIIKKFKAQKKMLHLLVVAAEWPLVAYQLVTKKSYLVPAAALAAAWYLGRDAQSLTDYLLAYGAAGAVTVAGVKMTESAIPLSGMHAPPAMF